MRTARRDQIRALAHGRRFVSRADLVMRMVAESMFIRPPDSPGRRSASRSNPVMTHAATLRFAAVGTISLVR